MAHHANNQLLVVCMEKIHLILDQALNLLNEEYKIDEGYNNRLYHDIIQNLVISSDECDNPEQAMDIILNQLDQIKM